MVTNFDSPGRPPEDATPPPHSQTRFFYADHSYLLAVTERRQFCPECGDPFEAEQATPKPRTRREESLCTDCCLERFELIDAPDRVEIQVCASCGALHRGNRWVDVGARDYTDVAIDAVTEQLGVHVGAENVQWEVEAEQIDENTIRMHCRFTGSVRGTPVEKVVMVPVMIARGTCSRCGRISGDFYASTVQIRAADRAPSEAELERAREIASEVVADMEATGDRDAFVTEIATVEGGLNCKVSTSNIGRKISTQLVTEFGGRVSDSETLVTEDEDGNGVYRVSYAVRLPPYRPGEIIVPEQDDEPVLVRSARGNLKGVCLRTGEDYEASFEAGDAPDARRLGTRSDAEETTLVAVLDERSVQVLDPKTSETTTIARPSYLDADADTVPVLRSRAGLHVLPDE